MEKYIKLFNTDQEYQQALNNRELEEAVITSITGGNHEVPSIYIPSYRVTNNDDKVLLHYNENDDLKVYCGLEISWKPYGFVISNLEELGGNFIKPEKINILDIPTIYDGYRLYHIDNLTSNIAVYLNSLGYFDNSNIITASNALYSGKKAITFYREHLTWSNLTSINNLIGKTGDGSWVLETDEDVVFDFPKVTSCTSLLNRNDSAGYIFDNDVNYTFNLPLATSSSVCYYGKTKKCTWNLPECTSLSVNSNSERIITKENTLINSPKIENLSLTITPIVDTFSISDIIPSYTNLSSLTLAHSNNQSKAVSIKLDLSNRDIPIFNINCESDWTRHPNLNDIIIDYTNNTTTMLDTPIVSNAVDPIVDWSRVILKANMFNNCTFNSIPFNEIPYEDGVVKPIYTNCTFKGSGYIDLKSDGIAIEDSNTTAFASNNTIGKDITLKNFDCFKHMVFPKYITDDVIWTSPLNAKHSEVLFDAYNSNISIFNIASIKVKPLSLTNGWISLNGGDYTGYDTTFDFGTLEQPIDFSSEFYLIKARTSMGALPKLKGIIKIKYNSTGVIKPNICDKSYTELNAEELLILLRAGTQNFISNYAMKFPRELVKFNLGHCEFSLNLSECTNLDISTVEASLLRQGAFKYWSSRTQRSSLRILKKDWDRLSTECQNNCNLRYKTVDVVSN